VLNLNFHRIRSQFLLPDNPAFQSLAFAGLKVMGSSCESSDQVDDQIYMPSTGGGVFSARHPGHEDKSLRRRSTVKDGDVETASVNEKDDGVDERDFHKKQVFTGWQLAW
jgi:KUP system potassium uptake protein